MSVVIVSASEIRGMMTKAIENRAALSGDRESAAIVRDQQTEHPRGSDPARESAAFDRQASARSERTKCRDAGSLREGQSLLREHAHDESVRTVACSVFFDRFA